MTLSFPKKLLKECQRHAEQMYPIESCGIVVKGQYRSLKNCHKKPKDNFLINKKDYLKYKGEIEAIVHSHPKGADYPSLADMQAQQSHGIPFIVVSLKKGVASPPFIFGGKIKRPPLENRIFRHGVTDCWGLVRDYLALKKKMIIPDIPRGWEWWDDERSQDIYDRFVNAYKKIGYKKLETFNLKKGDIIVMSLRTKVPNHSSVYIGDGLLMHHMAGRDGYDLYRTPKIDLVTRWQKYFVDIFRNENYLS